MADSVAEPSMSCSTRRPTSTRTTSELMDPLCAVRWVRTAHRAIHLQRDHLTFLDAATGDGDHGTNLARAFDLARAGLEGEDPTPRATVGSVLLATGETLRATAGGASGALQGGAWRAAGAALHDEHAVDASALADALRHGLATIQALGAAEVGDKTCVDAYAPAVEALEHAARAGANLYTATAAAAAAAAAGARSTTALKATRGRAYFHGWNGIGDQDPGAASTALIFGALHDSFAEQRPPSAGWLEPAATRSRCGRGRSS